MFDLCFSLGLVLMVMALALHTYVRQRWKLREQENLPPSSELDKRSQLLLNLAKASVLVGVYLVVLAFIRYTKYQ